MKKGYYWFLGILLVLIIANPSVKAFKDYLGTTSYLNLRRENNFFVCSKYKFREKTYFAILGNFFDVTTIKKPMYVPTKHPVLIDTSAITIAPPPLPKGYTKIIKMASYKDRVYLALSDNVPGFNTDYDKFNLATKNKDYLLEIYKILKENLSDFHRSKDDFLKLMNTPGEPKDEFGIPFKSKY